jgi:hypothetical protein
MNKHEFLLIMSNQFENESSETKEFIALEMSQNEKIDYYKGFFDGLELFAQHCPEIKPQGPEGRLLSLLLRVSAHRIMND